MNQHDLPAFIRADLDQVDAILRERTGEQASLIRAVSQTTVHAGPPMFLAALLLLAAHTGAPEGDQRLHAAAAIELIRISANVHGLLVDTAEIRQNTPADDMHDVSGTSLMIGDYLLALSSVEMARTPHAAIIEALSQAVMAISESRLTPVPAAVPLERGREQYLAAIGGTTALYRAAGRAGGLAGEVDEAQLQLLVETFGAFGIAAQITADTQAGRQGMFNGSITLPMLYAVASDQSLAPLVEQSAIAGAEAAVLADAITRFAADARALNDAQTYMHKARQGFLLLPPSPAREALVALAERPLETSHL